MNDTKDSEQFKLQNYQLSFPLYVASRNVLRKYAPILKPLKLTYTQYIVLISLWENKQMTVGELGKKLNLDTGTLSPLLKSMEMKGFIKKSRRQNDERVVCIEITSKSDELKKVAQNIPKKIRNELPLSDNELSTLNALLKKLL